MKPAKPSPAPPAPRRSSLLRLRPFVVVAALIATVYGALTIVERRPEYLCRHWEDAAREAEPARARQLIAKLDAYGSFGIPALVRLAAADEAHVAEAARNALQTRLKRATSGESLADEAAAVQIGDELDAMLRRRSAPTPQALVDVALTLLEATGGMAAARRLDPDQRAKLIEVCDMALRRAAAPKSPLATILPPPEVPLDARSSNDGATKIVAATPGTNASGSASLSSTASSFVSRPPSNSTTAGSKASTGSPDVAAPQPAVFEPRTAANTAARIEQPTDAVVDPAVRPASTAPPSAAPTDSSGNPLRSSSSTTPRLVQPPNAADDPSRLDAWALFALVDGDPRAFTELRRRGFSPREIDVGRHLASDDVLERRRYAQMLPSLGGIDVRPWLLHLCDDADGEVRRAAATIMATTNDPTLLDRLRTMSLDDADDQVREIAARSMDRGAKR